MLKIIRLIGVTECGIGLVTLGSMIVQLIAFTTSKTAAVFAFVGGTALISFAIGLRLLQRDEKARAYLIYFSGYILIEKFLIFAGILTLSGKVFETVTGLPTDWVSFVYHTFVLLILMRPSARALFDRKL